jgi:hypothetical protein
MKDGEGWLLYSWIMLFIAGMFAIINGVVAIANANFFTAYGAQYVWTNLSAWGWFALIMGILAVVAAFSVMRGGEYGRWFGIVVAGIQLLVQIFWIPIVPFWALTVMLLDILVIYGLAVYGGKQGREH